MPSHYEEESAAARIANVAARTRRSLAPGTRHGVAGAVSSGSVEKLDRVMIRIAPTRR